MVGCLVDKACGLTREKFLSGLRRYFELSSSSTLPDLNLSGSTPQAKRVRYDSEEDGDAQEIKDTGEDIILSLPIHIRAKSRAHSALPLSLSSDSLLYDDQNDDTINTPPHRTRTVEISPYALSPSP